MKRINVKIRQDLIARAAKLATVAGYSSTEEFVEHVLEREIAKIEPDQASDAEILRKLKGLGYID